jgi:hypothetical protein
MSSELVLHCVGLTVWSRLYTPGIPKGSTLQLERAPKTGAFVLIVHRSMDDTTHAKEILNRTRPETLEHY